MFISPRLWSVTVFNHRKRLCFFLHNTRLVVRFYAKKCCIRSEVKKVGFRACSTRNPCHLFLYLRKVKSWLNIYRSTRVIQPYKLRWSLSFATSVFILAKKTTSHAWLGPSLSVRPHKSSRRTGSEYSRLILMTRSDLVTSDSRSSDKPI